MLDDGELDWKLIAINASDPSQTKSTTSTTWTRCTLVPWPASANGSAGTRPRTTSQSTPSATAKKPSAKTSPSRSSKRPTTTTTTSSEERPTPESSGSNKCAPFRPPFEPTPDSPLSTPQLPPRCANI